MASLYDLLLGQAQGTAEAQSQNPFMQAAQGVRGWQYQPTTSSEALWMPAVQGLLGGFLAGQGKKNAANTAYQQYKGMNLLQGLNPTLPGGVQGPLTLEETNLHNYGLDAAPEGWTPDIGKMDLATALADKAKKEEATAKIIDTISRADPNVGADLMKKVYGVDLGEVAQVTDPDRELRKRQLDEIQARFEESKNRKDAETSFPGYEFDKDAVRPTPSEASKVREELANNEKLISTLEVMKDSVDKDGFMNIFGNDAQMQAALQSFIFNTQRKATGSGARLEGQEAKMIKDMTPAVLSGDFAGAIKAALTNRSPSQLATDMIGVIGKTQDAMMKGRYKASRIKQEVDETAKTTTSSIPEGALDTGKRTKSGQIVYSYNGKEGVFE